MTVSIPISANADGVKAAFDAIRDAIKRADQEGRDFAKVDLSHPELKHLAEDIKAVTRNFETLSRMGRGSTAAAIRSGGFANPLDWYDRSRTLFPDARDLDRHLQMAGGYMLRGTSFEPGAMGPMASMPVPAVAPRAGAASPPRPAPHGPRPIGGALTTLMDGAVGGAAAATGFLFAAALGGGVASLANRGLKQAEGEDVANDTLMRRLGPLSGDFFALRTAIERTTEGLQLTYGESQKLASSWARLTNETDTGRLASSVRLAAGVARGYGIAPEAMSSVLGRAAYLGEDPRRFALLIGEAVNQGHQTGQVEQVMSALLQWSQTASRFLVTRTDVAGFASMYAGLNATGLPGLRGQNAASLISRINQSVMAGGSGGMAGQALTFRAFGRYGITDPYQIQYMLAGGMFERMGPGGPTIFSAELGELEREYAGVKPYQRWFAISRMFGINPRQARALESFKPGTIGTAEAWLKKSGLDLSQVNPTALRDIGGILNADEAGLQRYATAFRRRTDVPAGIADLLNGLHGNELREQLVRLEAKYGMQQTEATKLNQGLSNLSNRLTDTGHALVPVITTMNDWLSKLIGPVRKIATDLDEWLGKQGIHTPKISENQTLRASAQFVEAFGAPGAFRSHVGGKIGALARAGTPDPLTLERERRDYQFFIAHGLSSYAAIGLVTQKVAESGDLSHPSRGDGGLARGSVQWHPDRIARYKAWAARTGHPRFSQSSGLDQDAFMLWEATSPDSPESKNAARGLAARSYYGAAKLLSHDYVRPAGGWDTATVRGQLAGKVAANVLGTPLPTPPAGAPAPAQHVHVTVSAHPLEVQHTGPSGEMGRTEYLPVETHHSQPTPYGAARDPGPLALGSLGVNYGHGPAAPGRWGIPNDANLPPPDFLPIPPVPPQQVAGTGLPPGPWRSGY